MNNNELFRRLMNDDPLAELQAELEGELELPEDLRDYDKIAELTAAMAEMTDCAPDVNAEERCIQAVRNDLAVQKKKRRFSVVSRWLAAAAACFTVFAALNVYTMSTFGEDFFSTVVKFTQNGFSLDFSQNTMPSGGTISGVPVTTGSNPLSTVPAMAAVTTEQPLTPAATTENSHGSTDNAEAYTTHAVTTSPAGMIPPIVTLTPSTGQPDNFADEIDRILTESGQFKLLIPHYNSDMSMTSHDHETTSNSEDFYFTFSNSEKQLDFIIEVYNFRGDIPLNLVPSENSKMMSVNNNFATVYMFEEDSHTTAMFVYDMAVYTIVGHNMNISEMADVALSYREQN